MIAKSQDLGIHAQFFKTPRVNQMNQNSENNWSGIFQKNIQKSPELSWSIVNRTREDKKLQNAKRKTSFN